MRGQWLAGAALFLTTAAAGEMLPPGLSGGEPAEVKAVLAGDTLRLADGGEVRLAAIVAPHATPPRPGQPARHDPELEQLGEAARQRLATMVGDQRITVYVTGPSRDRHGRQVAHVAGPAGDWVQSALVSQGLARVQTTADSSLGAGILLRLEAAARDARIGLWRHEAFRVRAPDELGRWIETFQIIEGTVVPVAGRPAGRLALEGKGARLALNLSAPARSGLRAAGWNAKKLAGQTVRVRGWVRWQGGPAIDVTHAAQLEPLEPR